MNEISPQIYLYIGVLVLLGLALCWMGFRRLFGRRLLAGGTTTLLGLLLISGAIASVGVLANLYTYQVLTDEQAVGTLRFKAYAPQEFIATLYPVQGNEREFTVFGDQCQIDARILKWHGGGNLLGLETLYRLERLSGRYDKMESEQNAPRSVHALSEQAGIELWDLVNQFKNWVPWIDAVYGNAVYIPMRSGAEFQISVSISGLTARPTNRIAEQAIKDWK